MIDLGARGTGAVHQMVAQRAEHRSVDHDRIVAGVGSTVEADDRTREQVDEEVDGGLLLAGEGADAAMTCLGYRVSERWADPAALKAPPDAEQRPMPRARAELVRHLASTIVDSSDVYDGRRVSCSVPVPGRVDTLLRTINDRPVAIRLEYADGRTVTLVADDGLFRNRTLRRTAAVMKSAPPRTATSATRRILRPMPTGPEPLTIHAMPPTSARVSIKTAAVHSASVAASAERASTVVWFSPGLITAISVSSPSPSAIVGCPMLPSPPYTGPGPRRSRSTKS